MELPRIKTVFPPMPAGDGVIRIGGADYGLAAELTDDAKGHLWRLLGLLDGSRTFNEIVAAMRQDDPALTRADIVAVVRQLEEAGYLEDATPSPALSKFSSLEAERYSRNFEFFSYFHLPPLTNHDLQARLKEARVTVLGLGGLGSFVALGLASAGVGDLLLVDDDTVELSNLNRQVLYTERDIGDLKCDAAARRLREVNPHVKVTARRLRVSGVADAEDCMRGRDLLVCAADRPRIRIYQWLNLAAHSQGVAWIRGANDGMTVNLMLHVPGETACFECEQLAGLALNPWYGNIIKYATEVIGDRTINPCTAPVAGLIGNLVALECVKRLTGCSAPVIHNRKMSLDLRTLQINFFEGERQAACPVCGPAPAEKTEAREWAARS